MTWAWLWIVILKKEKKNKEKTNNYKDISEDKLRTLSEVT